jgi:hypothetical protein
MTLSVQQAEAGQVDGSPTEADDAEQAEQADTRPARGDRFLARLQRVRDVLPGPIRRRLGDLTCYAFFLVLAIWTDLRVWRDPYHRISGHLPTDNIQFEWFLSHSAYTVSHLSNPLFNTQMNAPHGVNMMANTSVLGVGIPLAPITILFGPAISYLVFLTLALAGSAATAYYVLSRYVVSSRAAAFIGGGFFGFAPGIIHHANGQPNFVADFLLPLIVLRVFRLGEPGKAVRNGITLGLLMVWQIFINEELLLLTAVGSVVAIALYSLFCWRDSLRKAKTFVLAGLIAVGCAVPLAIYPIWFQFRGPQSYHGIQSLFLDWGEDVTSYFTFSRDTLAGSAGPEKIIGMTEQNTWFGAPLMVLILLMIVLTWRRSVIVRIATLVGFGFAILASGPQLRVDTKITDITMPWRYFRHVPLVQFMYPSRWSYVVIGAVTVLLAAATDILIKADLEIPSLPVRFRTAWWIAVAVALIPIVPKPMPTVLAPNVPHFMTSGGWRPYADDRHTMVTVPAPGNVIGLKAMLWSAASLQEVKMVRGYFLGPNAQGVGDFGTEHRHLSLFMEYIYKGDPLKSSWDQIKAWTVEDLRYWNAAIMVLDVTEHNATQLREFITQATGITPSLSDGVWVWDVRPIVDRTNR